jgi:UDP-N-acetylglucosamine diphosphorylase/glucosamine-1-phosphate N-acetyltransferase
MKYLLFTQEGVNIKGLYPFTLTRNPQDMMMGMMTNRQRWERTLHLPSIDLEESGKLPSLHPQIKWQDIKASDTVYLLQSNLLPSKNLISKIKKLKPGGAIAAADGQILVYLLGEKQLSKEKKMPEPNEVTILHDLLKIEFSWDIFGLNKQMLQYDFEWLTKNKKSEPIDKTNRISELKNVFVERGAVLKHIIINAEDGPVFISKNALVMEGSCLRGPIFIGENAVVKMGSKIYGATTIGPGCTIGGEIKNVVMFGNSNKAHDGYLGDSVIGEWCNMGAGTSNSNLKNTAGNIVVHLQNQKLEAGQKCGVLMGDFSRTAINTSINTGTVIGVSCNVFGEGLTPKHIPSFAWGMSGEVKYKQEKALRDADNWKKLKNEILSETEKSILTNIYKQIK